MLQNGQITDFAKKIIPTLGQIISGTKGDKDKPIFLYIMTESIRSIT